jgi:hypothetical protein
MNRFVRGIMLAFVGALPCVIVGQGIPRQKIPPEQYSRGERRADALASGEIKWHNTWDFLSWKNCDAMVEPQGFLPMAEPSVEQDSRSGTVILTRIA